MVAKQMKSWKIFLILFYKNIKKNLEEEINGNEFVLDSIHLLHYKCRKKSVNCGGSCLDSLKWLKNKNQTINSKNNDKKCFQYAKTVALNHKIIAKGPQRI